MICTVAFGVMGACGTDDAGTNAVTPDGPDSSADGGTTSTGGADVAPSAAPGPVTIVLQNDGPSPVSVILGQDNSLCPSLSSSITLRTTDGEGAVVRPVAECVVYCGDEPFACELAPCERLAATEVEPGASLRTTWSAEAEIDTAEGCTARALQSVGASFQVTACWASEVDDQGPALVDPTCATVRFTLDDEPIEVVLSTDDAA